LIKYTNTRSIERSCDLLTTTPRQKRELTGVSLEQVFDLSTQED